MSLSVKLQPTGSDRNALPTVLHRDFEADERIPGFTVCVINLGNDDVTIFLPHGARICVTPPA